MPIRVMLADDHAILLEGLRTLIESAGFEVAGTATDRDRLLEMVLEDPPDVAVVDIEMPGVNLVQLLAVLREKRAATKVLVLTGTDGRDVAELMAAGAGGYTLKQHAFDELVTAVRTVAEGRTYISPQVAAELIRSTQSGSPAQSPETLTTRQLEVLRLVAAGHTSRRIAGKLGIHLKTVDNHRRLLRERLGVQSTAEMIRVAKERGLI